jgi:hypothetical protein
MSLIVMVLQAAACLYLDSQAEPTELPKIVGEYARAIGRPAGTGCFIQPQSPERVNSAVDLILNRFRKEA